MKVLAVIRDVVIILGITTLCGLTVADRIAAENTRRARLETTTKAIQELEKLYKLAVFDQSDNKGIYHQIFRQGEVAIEYQKLQILRDLMPTAGVVVDASAAVPPRP